MSGLRSGVRASWRHARTRVRSWLWPVLQQSLAAGIAWLVAAPFADKHVPVFAPIAAVVALNTQMGQRAKQALNTLTGVFVGILVGELMVSIVPVTWIALIVATFVSMMVAAAAGGARVTVAQAAASSIITAAAAIGSPEPVGRVFDAVVGVAVALVISQVIFPPRPLRLVHKVEDSVLDDLSRGLHLASRVVAGDDVDPTHALGHLRSAADQLSDLATARDASTNVTRHSLAYVRERDRVRKARAASEHLDVVVLDALAVGRNTLVQTGTASPGTAAAGVDQPEISQAIETVGAVLHRFGERPPAHTDRRLLDPRRLRPSHGSDHAERSRTAVDLITDLDRVQQPLRDTDEGTDRRTVAARAAVELLVADARAYVWARSGLHRGDEPGAGRVHDADTDD